MGLGSSLLLIAVGAILRFAITVSTLVVSLFWMVVWAERRRNPDVPPTGSGTQPTARSATEY